MESKSLGLSTSEAVTLLYLNMHQVQIQYTIFLILIFFSNPKIYVLYIEKPGLAIAKRLLLAVQNQAAA
jgi:hypothetical protein